MNHRLYGLKLACTAALNAAMHPLQMYQAAKDFLVQTCPPELDSGYTEILDDDSEHIDLPLGPCEIDLARGCRPIPRTLEEAFPQDRHTLDGIPRHPTAFQWQERLTMAVGVLSLAATLAIVITTTPK